MKLKSLLKEIIRKQINEELYNKQFIITFRTYDGNKDQIWIAAHTEQAALRQFEREYEYDEIINIEEADED